MYSVPKSEILIYNLGPHLPTISPPAHVSLDSHRSRQICFSSGPRQRKWTRPFSCSPSQKGQMLTKPWTEWEPGQIINPLLHVKHDIKEFQYDCHFLYWQGVINETYNFYYLPTLQSDGLPEWGGILLLGSGEL